MPGMQAHVSASCRVFLAQPKTLIGAGRARRELGDGDEVGDVQPGASSC